MAVQTQGFHISKEAAVRPGLDRGRMTAVLVELTRTLVSDFSIQEMLDHLAQSVRDVLGVTGAGILLLDEHNDLRFTAATDHTILRVEALQIELGEGPCVTSHSTGEPVGIPDLANDTTHPRYSPLAVEAGLRAVYTFPLCLDEHRLGALDIYESTPLTLNDEEMTAAKILADVVTIYLFNAQARADAEQHTRDLEHRTLHDALTGLANRVLFSDRLEHALAGLTRTTSGVAILFIDIDRFKAINDTHGHQVGDELLTSFGARLTGLLRPSDSVARLGGDEFVVLCERLASRDEADAVATRMAARLREPFVLGDVELVVGVSVGIATTWDTLAGGSDLVMHADAAMYRAKRRGGDRRETATGADDDEVRPRRLVALDLKDAILHGRLALSYQPIVTSTAREWCSVEALLRWEHPEAGLLAPPLVVEVAESMGLENELSRWTLNSACATLSNADCEELCVAVNASARQLLHDGFLEAVHDALEQSGLNPQRLWIEVTEGALILDLAHATATLTALRSLGVQIALDDFGTGYSSLSYLKQLPIDILKIDRSFITSLASDPFDQAIVSALVGLAGVGNLTIVAEGVETEEQLVQARALGCDGVQGHLISRPIGPRDWDDQLARAPIAPLTHRVSQ